MTPDTRLTSSRVDGLVTVTGLGLLAALLIWIQVAAAVSGGRSAALTLLVTATGITFAAARLITRWCRWAVPALVTITAVGVLLSSSDVFVYLRSLLAYANATGAFCMLTAGAALMLAVRQSSMMVRAVALLVIVGFSAVVVLSGSRAAVVGIVLIGLALLARCQDKAVRKAILGGASLVVFAVAASATVGAFSLGVQGASATGDRLVDETLSASRVVLWHDALSMLRSRPLTGVGPGRFAEFSPTARGDADLRWAHNEFLQLAAETGAIGLVLGIAMAVWVFVRLWHSGRDAGTAVAALAIAALLSQAAVDYVLHFPLVTLTAAALAGAGAPPRRPGRLVGSSERRQVTELSTGKPGLTPPFPLMPSGRMRLATVLTRIHKSSRMQRWSM